MTLYKETSYEDWARRQRRSLQNSAQNLQQKQAGLEAAQNQKQKTTLESALSGLIGGLKERGSDIFNTAKNVAKYAVGQINQFGADKAIDKAQKDDSKRRNEIAKKYGFNSYSEAANSGNASQEFWNEIKNNNKQTREKQEQNKARQGSFGDVTKINTNEAKGQALNTIDSVLGLLPGAAANIAGGGLSGVGDEYKAAARENRDVNWTNARNNALVGAASGVAGMAGGNALGNAASKLGGNALGKLAGSQLAKGIAGGAASGAVGGGLGTYLNGGSLEDALLAAKEGAKAGGISGGVMAGTMGLGGKALDKFRGRTGSAPTTDIEPVEATTVQKNRIDQPTAQRIEAEAPSTRRGIAVTDLDAGEQAINVRNGRPTESRGKYIDSVVRRSEANLPEAQRPSVSERFRNNFDDTLENIIARGDMGDGADILDALKVSGVREPELAAIRSGARDYAGESSPFAAYGLSSRQDLPLLDRQEYYNDTIGKVGKQGNGNLTSADVPSYMQDRLRNNANKGIGYNFDNETILNELFGNRDLDKAEMYRMYEDLAATPQGAIYTPDNIGYALALDPELSAKAQRQMLDLAAPTRKISIESALTQAQPVDITDMTTNYRKSTIPARQYDQQTVKNIPEAETAIATRQTTELAPIETTQPTKKQTALSRGLRNTGNEMMSAQTNITRAERKRLGIDSAGEVVNNTRKRTGISDIYEQEQFAKNITGSQDSVMDNIQRVQMAKNQKPLTVDDYKAALAPVIEEGWSKLTMGDDKAKKQFITNVIDDLGKKDPIDAANYLKDQAAAENAVAKGNSEGAPKAKTKAKLYTELANKMDDLTYSSIPEENVRAMYNDTIAEFRMRADEAAEAGNKKFAKAYEKLATELENIPDSQKTIKNYRSFKKDFVKSSQVARISEGARSGSLDAGLGRGFNVKNKLANTFIGPVLDKGLAAFGGVLNDAADRLENRTQNSGETVGKAAGAAKNLAGKAANLVNNATSKLNNESLSGIEIGNRIGKTQSNIVPETTTLGNVVQNAANRQIGYGQARDAVERQNNAQAISQAQSDYDNALADYQAQEATYNNQMAQLQSQSANSQLDRIANAMEMALNAGDITAYGQLADLYTQAAKIEELRNPTAATADLSAAQKTKLNELDTSLNTLDQLKNAYEQAGGGKGLVGVISEGANKLTGGASNRNLATYNDLKNSLGMAIVKNVVNAGGTEQDAKRYTAMLPSASDTPEQAAQKFAYLEEMLNNAKQSVYSY